MKKESRKLQLNRETLITMENDDLDMIYGGVSPSTTTIPIGSAVSRASAASSAACLRAASTVVKYTARSVSAVASAVAYSVKTVFGSRGCGPTQGGSQDAPSGGEGGGGGGGGEG